MKLFYFTNSFPYGIGEQWKLNELKVLVNYFEEITVIPFSYAGNFDMPKQVPPKVKVEQPLFNDDNFAVTKKEILGLFLSKNFFSYLIEFIKVLFKFNKPLILSLFSSMKKINLLENHTTIKEIIKGSNNCTILYFYWGIGSSEMVPFIIYLKFKKVVIKMHRYDLYNYANNGYIPFRSKLLNCPIVLAPSSNDGNLYLKQNYPNHKAKICTMRCGTMGNGKLANYSKDNVLRIISCSLLVPVKRINLMIEACKQIEFPFEWKHIGYGPLDEDLKRQVSELELNEKFIFIGKIESENILSYYVENNFDVFVNVSSSEGVPFSIMEAFSVGIPVIATDAGGTKEIVDADVGFLLNNNTTSSEIAKCLEEFYNKSLNEKIKIRDNAYNRYLKMCNADVLANELGQYLIQ